MSLSSLCVILDLDETLVNTAVDYPDDEHVREMKGYLRSRLYDVRLPSLSETRGSGEVYDVVGIKRPGLEEFLEFCFNYFKVVTIWSAGKKIYVDHLVSYLFRNIGMPHAIYTREDCKVLDDGNFHKPISEMISRESGFGGIMTLNNTLIIDDQVTNAIDNPGNIILIPQYLPELSPKGVMMDDGCFLKLKNWFLRNDVMSSSDVRRLDKGKIFSPL